MHMHRCALSAGSLMACGQKGLLLNSYTHPGLCLEKQKNLSRCDRTAASRWQENLYFSKKGISISTLLMPTTTQISIYMKKNQFCHGWGRQRWKSKELI